jgi:KDO2-lipid IV(A) lauroyltransferase
MSSRIILFLLQMASKMPLPMARGIGRLVGRLLYLIPNKQRHIHQVNIGICFPEKSEQEQNELLRSSLIENLTTMMELPAVWLGDASTWVHMAEPGEGFSELKQVMAEGNGAILAGPHLGNWEVAFIYLSALFPTTALYRPPREKALDDPIYLGRRKGGGELAPATVQGVKKLITALKKGDALFILTDQAPKAAGKQGSVFAPFFGREAPTMVLVNSLARKTNAPVFFFFAERTPSGKYRLNCYRAPEGVDNADVDEAAAAINLGLEECIRQSPEQYLWGYKKFEKSPDGGRSPYSRSK